MKINWKYIILFILIALGSSYPIQTGFFDSFFQSITHSSFLSHSSYLMAGLSTVLSAIIVFLFQKNISSRITILGDESIKNVTIAMLPIFAFSIVGLNNEFGMNKSLYGFLFASVNTVYAFAEEVGWRRYLQNALEGLNKNIKYIFIGVVWWIWHFRFETQFDLFVFPLICLGGGYLLGKLADDTKSILPVVSMHTLIILVTITGQFGKHQVLGITIVVIGWIVIEQVWKRKFPAKQQPNSQNK
jgi:hypothetical protein